VPLEMRPANWEEHVEGDTAAFETEKQKKLDQVAASRARERAKKQRIKELSEGGSGGGMIGGGFNAVARNTVAPPKTSSMNVDG